MDEVKAGLRENIERIFAENRLPPDVLQTTDALVGNFRGILSNAIDQFREPFCDQIETMLGMSDDSLVMPEGCKYIWSDARTVICVVEQPPTQRMVKFDMPYEVLSDDGDHLGYDRITGTHKLAFPFIEFILKLHKGRSGVNPTYRFGELMVGYMNKSFVKMGDMLCFPNLPNVGGDAAVCTGTMRVQKWGKSLPEQVGGVITHFWNSTFNGDLNINYIAMTKADARVRSPLTWDAATRMDPLFPLKVKWKPFKKMKDIIGQLRRSGNSGDVAQVNSAVLELFKDIWREVLPNAVPEVAVQDLASAFEREFQAMMVRFSDKMVDKLKICDSPAVRSQLSFAMTAAIKAALRRD